MALASLDDHGSDRLFTGVGNNLGGKVCVLCVPHPENPTTRARWFYDGKSKNLGDIITEEGHIKWFEDCKFPN
jgi:hypothetical protein